MSTTKTQAVVDSVVEQQYDGDPAAVVGYDDMQGSINSANKKYGLVEYEYTYGLGTQLYGSLAWQVDSHATFTLQTPHAMKLNSIVDMHMHYSLTADHAGKSVRFKVSVIAAGVGEAFAEVVDSVEIEVELGVTRATAGSDAFTHYLIELGNIPAVNTSVSSIYKVLLERIDVAEVGAVEASQYFIMEYFDCHVQLDQERGSREEYVK